MSCADKTIGGQASRHHARITISALKSALIWANSYQRMPLLIDAMPSRLEPGQRRQWLKLLGEEWISCDNVGPYREDLAYAFETSPGDWRLLMDKKERARYDALPAQVRLYRGCGRINRLGLSWTENKEIAARFPKLSRYRTPNPVLLEAVVPKERIVAAKDGRGEAEIVALVEERYIRREKSL